MLERNIIWTAILLLSVSFVSAQFFDSPITDVKSGESIVDGKSQLLDSWASLEVNPSTAFSIPSLREFSQSLTVCNKADDAGYFFLDYYFDHELMNYNMTRVDEWVNVEVREEPVNECHEIGEVSKSTNKTVCSVNGTNKFNYTTTGQTKTLLKIPDKKLWGKVNHYVNPEGQLLSKGECKQYLLKYKTVPSDTSGKWNFRVWGNTKDDWTCLETETCPFDYTLDPTYSTAFTYKQQINITNPSWSINNYTVEVLFNLSNHNFNLTQPDGDDVIFTNEDETIALGCYKETFVNTSLGNYSVMLPNFTNTTATTIWVYFGNTTMPNQCPEINNGYLLGDTMMGATINTSIWNQRQGTAWSAGGVGSGYIDASTTLAEYCLEPMNIANTAQCGLYANNSGILKSSQSIIADYQYFKSASSSTDCGYGVALGNLNTSNAELGNNNASMMIPYSSLVFILGYNKVSLGTAGATRVVGYKYNESFVWSNGWQPIIAVMSDMVIGGGKVTVISKNHNVNAINQTFAFGLYMNDGSGGTPCSNTRFYGIRVHGFINNTPSLVFGSITSVSANPVALSVNNETWESVGVFETGLVNFSINVTVDKNFYNNISAVNFSYNGTTYKDSQISNVTYLNTTLFTVSIRVPLIVYNTTTFNFNWSFQQTGNGSVTAMANSSNRSQVALWNWWVNNVSWSSPVASGMSNSFVFNLSKMANDGSPFIHNITLEYNGTNQTVNATLTYNNTNYEIYTFTMTAPTVIIDSVVNWTSWHQMNFSPNTVNRRNITSTTLSNGTQTIIADGGILNETYTTPLFETSISNHSINISTVSVTITNVNFTWNGTIYEGESNLTGTNWSYFNISLAVPLTVVNNTNYTFQWNYSTSLPRNSSSNNTNQTLYWAYYPSGLVIANVNVTETQEQDVNYSIVRHVNNTGVVFATEVQYNLTNFTNSTLVSITLPYLDYKDNFNIGFVSTSYATNVTVNITPYLNVSYGSISVVRSRADVNGTQQVNKMILSDCITSPFGTGNVTNFFIKDSSTLTLIPIADTTISYLFWNNSATYNRYYSNTDLDNATPSTCMLPSWTGFSLQSNFNVTASATGYQPKTVFYVSQGLFVGTLNITILLANESINVTYANYTTNGGSDYVRQLNITVSYSCPDILNSSILRYINGTLNTNMTATCTNATTTYEEYYIHSSEGQYNISYSLLDSIGGGDNTTNTTFISDLYNPSVAELFLTSSLGFFNVSGAFNATMNCTDNIYTPLNYSLIYNHSNIMVNGTYVNSTRQTNQTVLSDGINTFTATCADPFGSTSSSTNITVYLKNLKLIDERNNTPCDVGNLTGAKVFIDDNSTLFDFKLYNVTSVNITEINYSSFNSSRLRFELTYSSGAIITRYIDVSLFNNTGNVRVCCNKEGVTHFEQIITSAISRPVWLKGIFAQCYVAADYTRFAYQDRKMLKAFTIQQPYYLTTQINTGIVQLASLDGSVQTEINLDTLELIATPFDFSVLTSALTFQHSGVNTTTILYLNAEGDNINGTIVITDISNNAVMYNSTVATPNNWTLVFDYTTLNLSNSTMFQITYTALTNSGAYKVTKAYFNGRGADGIIMNAIAAIVSLLLLLFGLSITSARITFAWLGLVICLASFVVLVLAAGGVWYITFLQALTAVVMVYIVINLVKQGGDVIT